jgi:hypothetical protein
MGNSPSDAKRAERKQRSEQDKQLHERQKRAQVTRSRLFLVVAVLAVVGAIILGVTRRSDAEQVWSPEHGHWHKK